MTPTIACLFDCDNTLIDNDAIKADLTVAVRDLVGDERAETFWRAYEDVRAETGVVDYPLVVRRLRLSLGDALADRVWAAIWDYPFADRVYTGSLPAIARARDIGCVVGILSDGDQRYQPHKIDASGLAAAVGGNVRIFSHKQQHLGEIESWLPADRYIIVDDKATILADLKRMQPDRFRTVHVRQGHYASQISDPAPDLTIAGIGDLATLTLDDLLR